MKLFQDEIKEDYCEKCGLYKTSNSPKAGASGFGETNTLLLTESSEKTLKKYLKAFGYDLDKDFWKLNPVSCLTEMKGEKKPPTASEIKHCKPHIDNIIKELNPEYIMLLGGAALDSFLLGDFEKIGINVLRGMIIYDQKYKKWVLPLYSSKYIDKNDYDQNLKSLYSRDLRHATEFIENPTDKPVINFKPELLYNYTDILNALHEAIKARKTVYFDYETTGLKPFRPGHKIVCISLAFQNRVVAFPFQYKDFFSFKEQKEIKSLMRKILLTCPVEAHNINFEDSWSQNILGVKPQHWQFDTMIAAHILDNRSDITGLKLQTYINFGVRPYDRDIKKYLKGDEFGFNSVEEIPLEKLLLYCANDSGYGRMLSRVQKKQLKDRGLIKPYKLFHDSIQLLGQMHQNGICADEDYFNEQDVILTERVAEIEKKLLSSEESKKFRKNFGRVLNLTSSKDLGELFYNVLGLEGKRTEKGNLSVDKGTLEKMKIPFVTDLLLMRKLEKARGTYLAQFKREIINGKINAFFSLNNVVSFRSGSNSPNLQNIPTREEEVKKIIRSGMKASPDRQLFFFDFAGAEVKTAVCYNKDPNMIKYIIDPTTDMHFDTGMSIFLLPPEEMTKDIRFYAKNQWVFAQFYGSWWLDCGSNLWSSCIDELNLKTKTGIPLVEHLYSKGIRDQDEFLEHCEDVEKKFWGERFKVYAEWKKEVNLEYQRKGYLESYFGFRFSGYMDRKQASNYLIQGTSFHILLWCMLEIEKIAVKENWQSVPIMEIHDEEVFDAVPEEIPRMVEVIKDVVHNQLPAKLPWINVPFDVEFSVTPIGGSWYEKQDYKEVI